MITFYLTGCKRSDKLSFVPQGSGSTVEQRSPKPPVARSNRVSPATDIKRAVPFSGTALFVMIKTLYIRGCRDDRHPRRYYPY